MDSSSADDFYKSFNKGQTLKQLSPEENAEIQRRLAHPDMRPQQFDGTLEAWLMRIALWGNITIKHNHPEERIVWKEVTGDQFLDRLNVSDTDTFGIWSQEQKAVNKMVFYRKYTQYNGKNYKEEFSIEIKLKSSLQQALDGAKKRGIFGWFR